MNYEKALRDQYPSAKSINVHSSGHFTVIREDGSAFGGYAEAFFRPDPMKIAGVHYDCYPLIMACAKAQKRDLDADFLAEMESRYPAAFHRRAA